MLSNISKQTFVILFFILLCVINYYILLREFKFNCPEFFSQKLNKSKKQVFISKETSAFMDIQNQRLDWIKKVCIQNYTLYR